MTAVGFLSSVVHGLDIMGESESFGSVQDAVSPALETEPRDAGRVHSTRGKLKGRGADSCRLCMWISKPRAEWEAFTSVETSV